MHTSEKLLADLADANIIIKDHDKVLAQHIVRKYPCDVHQEAVQATVMATNKLKYVEPQFLDI